MSSHLQKYVSKLNQEKYRYKLEVIQIKNKNIIIKVAIFVIFLFMIIYDKYKQKQEGNLKKWIYNQHEESNGVFVFYFVKNIDIE